MRRPSLWGQSPGTTESLLPLSPNIRSPRPQHSHSYPFPPLHPIPRGKRIWSWLQLVPHLSFQLEWGRRSDPWGQEGTLWAHESIMRRKLARSLWAAADIISGSSLVILPEAFKFGLNFPQSQRFLFRLSFSPKWLHLLRDPHMASLHSGCASCLPDHSTDHQ